MKNKIFIILNFVLSFLFVSCNQKTEIDYYDTGEVRRIKKRINEHDSEVCFYLKNGQLTQKGIVSDSLREGKWNIYYSDGVLCGELIFYKDEVVKENIRYPITLDFKDNPLEFKTGNSYPFRVLGVAFFDIKVPPKLGYKRNSPINFDEAYWNEITPEIAGSDTILVIIVDPQTHLDKDTIFFPIKVADGGEIIEP